MHRKNKSKSYVRNNFLITDSADNGTDNPIQVDSQAWYGWLADHDGFIYEGDVGHINARKELRRGINYWYGYRRRDGKLSKVYLGKSEDLTKEFLNEACARLAGQLPTEQIPSNANPAGDNPAPKPIGSNVISCSGIFAEVPSLPLTKFQRPALPLTLISRPELTRRVLTPITIISAPSGFGKSTLLNKWHQSCGMQVAWVTLEAEDSNPQRFWSIIVTALQTIRSGFGHDWILLLNNSLPADLTQIVINLINDIVRMTDESNSSQGICLILDNYHHIQNPAIHTSLQTFLENIPPKLSLVIASQTKPPLELGHLRSKGIVSELGVDDLRFTLEEGIEFLSHHKVMETLVHEDRQKLVRRMEGWITGLVLAVSALAQEEEPTRFIESFTGAHPFLREYFSKNVLNQQSREVQVFLLKTSILNQLRAPLCNIVTGKRNGNEMLTSLWEKKLFLQRLEEPGWYRYHGLFAEMLQAQLGEQFPTDVADLHHMAAGWFSAENAPADAIHHLLASQAWEEAAIMIESVANKELEQSGEGPRLMRWLQQLPEPVLRENGTLLLIYLRLAMLSLPSTEVARIIARMGGQTTPSPSSAPTDDTREILSSIRHIHRTWVTDNKSRLKSTVNRKQDAVHRMMDNILQFERDYRRDLVQAELKASTVYKTARARSHLYGLLISGGAYAKLVFSQGHLRQAEQIAHQVLRQSIELSGKLPELASIALTALCWVYFERNQFTQVHQLLERAIEVNPNPISTNESVTLAILRAKVQSLQGDTDAAFATVQAAREMQAQHPSNMWLDQDLVAYQALFHLHHGDLDSAEQLLQVGWDIDMHPFSAFVHASILETQNRYVAAEDILRHLLNRYPHGFYGFPILRVQAKLSLILFDQHKVNQASQVMAEAARLAAPEYFIRPFLVSGPKAASLLSLVLHTENLNPGTRSFLKGLLTMLGYADGLQNILPRDESVALNIAASITPREQQMLRLLSASLSNQEIAEQCSIAPSTVKTHLENIYRKLGVNNRMQAIEQARMLNLV